MEKRDAISYLVLSLLGILGHFVSGYWGGVITGACLCMIFLVAVGRKAANQAAKKIDKTIRDMRVNRETENE